MENEIQPPKKQTLRQRGFILVIVLVGVLVVSAAVLLQLDTASATSLTSVRQKEGTKARGFAENCLNLGEAIARNYLTSSGALDFDCLLDSGGAGCDGVSDNDFVPVAADMAGSTVVYIPKSQATAPEPRRGAHRFRYMPVADGGCYLRFEDNSDEFGSATTGVALTNNSAAPGVIEEGPTIGTEVIHRDRDRAIFITAIGIYPQLGAVTADFYDKAHARVTLRRAFGASSIVVAGTGAINAGGDVTIGKGVDICGNGSISGDDVDLGSKGCACGDVTSNTPCTGKGCPPTGCSTAQCPVCNNTSPAATSPALPPPVVNVPSINLAGPTVPMEAFSSTIGAATNLGANGACEFYLRSGAGAGEVFYWDHADTNTAVEGDNCATYATDPVEAPCTWDTVAGTVSCGLTETDCWKLAGIIDNTPGDDAQLVGVLPASVDTGSLASWRVINNQRFNGFTNTDWSAFCGGCADCDGTNQSISYDTGSDRWVSEDTWDNQHFPTPSYVYVNNSAAQDFVFEGNEGDNNWSAATGPLKVTWISNGGVRFDSNGGSNLCGAECDCSTLTNIGGFTCDLAEAQLPPATTQECPVVRAAGRCDMQNGNDRYFGALQCGEIIADNAEPCVYGHMIATGPGPGTHDCTSGSMPAYCTQTSMCFKNNSLVLGDLTVDGNLCMKNNGDVNGDISVTGSFASKNNTNINGSITALGDVELKNNGTITATGGAAVAGFGGTVLSTFLEAPW